MTTDLEKQFFDTFELRYNSCTDNFFNPCRFECDECPYHEERYPQISERILLELICILLSNNSPYMFKLGDWDVEKLKDTVLTMCIKLPDFLEWENASEYFKHQVRKLFKEEVR